MNITVLKRDGSKEPFQKEKLDRVLEAAWTGNPGSDEIADQVEKRVKDLGKDTVTSLEIRNIVLEELKKADKKAYNFYRWYQKTKKAPPPSQTLP